MSTLIKSIPTELLPQVKQVVSESFSTLGFDSENLKKQIDGRFHVAKSRAKLIARDQTSKTIGKFTQIRQQSIGINEYIWRGAMDSRERATHVANEGLRINWNNPPATTGNVGQDINCRCTSIGIISEDTLNMLKQTARVVR